MFPPAGLIVELACRLLYIGVGEYFVSTIPALSPGMGFTSCTNVGNRSWAFGVTSEIFNHEATPPPKYI